MAARSPVSVPIQTNLAGDFSQHVRGSNIAALDPPATWA